MIKYRVSIPSGYIEFGTQGAADAYRTTHGISDPAQEVVEIEPFDAPTLIARAWSAADALARSYADENSRARFLLWLIDADTPPAVKTMIRSVQVAMDGIWMQYYAVAGQIQQGVAAEFDPALVPPCPHTFIEIASAAMNP
jgi:hypothetical protein